MSAQTIYCVEDDSSIRELIQYALTSGGFAPRGFESAEPFFEALQEERPALILLDIMLPARDGMEILAELRAKEATARVPVIMLTAKSGELDKVKALDGGADDYITKPFGVMELLSRVRALLRRTQQEDYVHSCGGIQIDYQKRTVTANGQGVTLTYKEFELLWFLLENRGFVQSRERLLNKLWGFDFEGESRTVDAHIKTLRQKLGECGDAIETVRNVGYKIE